MVVGEWPSLVGIILPPSGTRSPDLSTRGRPTRWHGGQPGSPIVGPRPAECCGSGQSGADRWVARRGRSRLALAISLRLVAVVPSADARDSCRRWPSLVGIILPPSGDPITGPQHPRPADAVARRSTGAPDRRAEAGGIAAVRGKVGLTDGC
jgi:hypothetical protein